jgi:hypothetical protein
MSERSKLHDAHSIVWLCHQYIRRRWTRLRRAVGEVVAFEDQVIQRSTPLHDSEMAAGESVLRALSGSGQPA